MNIIWIDKPLFKKIPLTLVLFVATIIAFNVYLNLKITNTENDLDRIESASIKPPRIVPAEFTKKVNLGDKSCPSITAGNPNAALQFKLFESETCPYCVAQNKVLDEILPEYGDLIYVKRYQVTDCQKESMQYKISGVPTFVFAVSGSEKDTIYGFLDKDQLIDYICRVSGKC